MTDRLFVYGTLMAGGVAAGMVEPCERRAATVRGALYHLPDGYPALVLGGEDDVHGELLSGVDLRRLDVLDAYEGVEQGLFQRVEVEVSAVDPRRRGRTVSAWAWVMAPHQVARGRRVPSGRWTSPIRR